MARWVNFKPGRAAAERTEYAGRKYASKLEARHAARLDSLRAAHDPKQRVVDWRPQVNVPLVVNGQHIATYRVDFLVTFADGREEWHETKGYAEEVWLLKSKLFEALFPDRILKVFR